MAIVREILLELESAPDTGMKTFTGERAYHAILMMDALLVDGIEHGTAVGVDRPQRVILRRLTWQGHELLDAIRDDTVWKKAQEQVLKPAGGFMLDVLLAWGKAEMASRLGVNL